jgi:hypothetical protein
MGKLCQNLVRDVKLRNRPVEVTKDDGLFSVLRLSFEWCAHKDHWIPFYSKAR